MDFAVKFTETPSMAVSFGSTSAIVVGNNDHRQLLYRDAEDQHPISAITALGKNLDAKLEKDAALTNQEIEDLIKSYV